jgi:hypothetical protein
LSGLFFELEDRRDISSEALVDLKRTTQRCASEHRTFHKEFDFVLNINIAYFTEKFHLKLGEA